MIIKTTISVDRQSKSVGIFKNFEMIRRFEPYRYDEFENMAVEAAKWWLQRHGHDADEAEIAYPRIDKIKAST